MNFSHMLDFYISQVEDDFIPYWSQFIDEEYGGLTNCISNDGSKIVSCDKYAWSQGRWLWTVSRIYELGKKGLFRKLSGDMLLSWMDGTFRFIRDHVISGDGRCCFVLERDGSWKIDQATGRYDTSIYADCFVLIGLSAYFKATDRIADTALADKVAESILSRIESGDYLTEPYPIPAGYRVHGVPMILVNTMQEYALMKEHFNQDASRYSSYSLRMTEMILTEFYDEERHLIKEHVSDNGNRLKTLLDRHINPGHTLEDSWFWIECLERYGDLSGWMDRIEGIVQATFALGWDKEEGGLLRFVDCEGGMPHGTSGESRYEELILNTWDMKLWWPHSEILYLFTLLYKLTGKQVYEDLYDRSFEYVFTLFPQGTDREWIQIRKRDGKPDDFPVALPVKDPFHILRNFLKIIERLS